MAWLKDFNKKREDRNIAKIERDREASYHLARHTPTRSEKVSDRRSFRLEKINAIKEKFYAVAAKRKWLFFIIAAIVVAYLVIFKGGSGSGILETIKGFF